MRRLITGFLIGFASLEAQTDTLIGYVKTGINGGPPIHQLVVDGEGNAELVVLETLDNGEVFEVSLDTDELAGLEAQFTDNGFENLSDSVWISGCLSCPLFALSYRGDSIIGNTPTQSENLNAILAALDALIEKIINTSPVEPGRAKETAFHLSPENLAVPFPHEIKMYSLRGDLLSRRRASGKKEYPLKRSEWPVVMEIVNTATGERYSRVGFLSPDFLPD